MKKIAVFLYGPPGSGKGTQANLLADKLGLIHFDSGKFLESVVHDPARQKEKTIRRERELFDTGMLMTPSFVFREFAREARMISKAGRGIVFSGAVRTLFEAKVLYPIIETLYGGKKNVFIFELVVAPKHSIGRNSNRLVCKVCGQALLTAFYPKGKAKCCPVCGGSFYRRTLDKPSVIKIRLEEYKTRTMPVFEFAKRRGYHVFKVNAEPAPYKVFGIINRRLHQEATGR